MFILTNYGYFLFLYVILSFKIAHAMSTTLTNPTHHLELATDPRDHSATPFPPATKTVRLHQMDGLRGIAMLLVFLGHFGSLWTASPHPAGAPTLYLKLIDADATFGSSFFMLLSGFFAYGALMRGNSFGRFLRGRLWRIYPLYIFMNVVYILGSLLIPSISKLPPTLGETAIFLVQTAFFLPGILPVAPLMEVAWTLSFVVAFYFIEGACVSLFQRIGATRLTRVLFLSTAAVLWVYFGHTSGLWQTRTVAFWVGMVLLEVVEAFSGAWIELASKLVLPAAVIAILGFWLRTDLMLRKPDTGPIPLIVWHTAITSVTLFAFVWVARFGPDWWKRLLSAKQLCKLGAASYSFYLTHGFAVKAFRFGIVPWLGKAAYLPVVFWVTQILGLALAIYISRVAYVLIEDPLSKLGQRPLGDLRGAATPT